MTKLLTTAMLAATLALAQTEVRRGTALPSYKTLKFAPLPEIKIPEPATVTLSNGMKIYLLESHELPIVSGFICIALFAYSLFMMRSSHDLRAAL